MEDGDREENPYEDAERRVARARNEERAEAERRVAEARIEMDRRLAEMDRRNGRDGTARAPSAEGFPAWPSAQNPNLSDLALSSWPSLPSRPQTPRRTATNIDYLAVDCPARAPVVLLSYRWFPLPTVRVRSLLSPSTSPR